jgi:hypothetical protein
MITVATEAIVTTNTIENQNRPTVNPHYVQSTYADLEYNTMGTRQTTDAEDIATAARLAYHSSTPVKVTSASTPKSLAVTIPKTYLVGTSTGKDAAAAGLIFTKSDHCMPFVQDCEL